MPKKPKPKPMVQDQVKKFEDAARELGCDDDETRFEEKLKQVARHKPPADTPSEQKPTARSVASKARK